MRFHAAVALTDHALDLEHRVRASTRDLHVLVAMRQAQLERHFLARLLLLLLRMRGRQFVERGRRLRVTRGFVDEVGWQAKDVDRKLVARA